MLFNRSSISIAILIALSAFSSCGKKYDENAARNTDGTCKGAFVDTYNKVVTDVKAVTNATQLISPSSSGAETQAALDTMVASAKKAQVSCKALMSQYLGLGTCEAKNPANGATMQVKAEDMKDSCAAMDQLADFEKYSTPTTPAGQ
jgi:hypothetical protein